MNFFGKISDSLSRRFARALAPELKDVIIKSLATLPSIDDIQDLRIKAIELQKEVSNAFNLQQRQIAEIERLASKLDTFHPDSLLDSEKPFIMSLLIHYDQLAKLSEDSSLIDIASKIQDLKLDFLTTLNMAGLELIHSDNVHFDYTIQKAVATVAIAYKSLHKTVHHIVHDGFKLISQKDMSFRVLRPQAVVVYKLIQ